MIPLLASLGSLSLGAMSNCLTVSVPLKCTCMPCLLHVLFKLFSQALDIWYNYGNAFVFLVAVVVPVIVVELSFCLIVDAVVVVF